MPEAAVSSCSNSVLAMVPSNFRCRRHPGAQHSHLKSHSSSRKHLHAARVRVCAPFGAAAALQQAPGGAAGLHARSDFSGRGEEARSHQPQPLRLDLDPPNSGTACENTTDFQFNALTAARGRLHLGRKNTQPRANTHDMFGNAETFLELLILQRWRFALDTRRAR